jgi:hypothetical protein
MPVKLNHLTTSGPQTSLDTAQNSIAATKMRLTVSEQIPVEVVSWVTVAAGTKKLQRKRGRRLWKTKICTGKSSCQ